MFDEIWKAVKGFEGLYEVSNLGRVKSLERRLQITSKNRKPYKKITSEKILKQYVDRYRYMKVVLYKNNKAHYFTVHRLVASAFVENTCKKNAVDHIDCNRKNNHANNLRWVTTKENQMYSHKLGRQKWNAKPIVAINSLGERFYFDSQREAAQTIGVNQSNVARCINGQKNSVKGWKFEYGSYESAI